MKEAAAAVLVRHDVDRPARASSASSESGSLELLLTLDALVGAAILRRTNGCSSTARARCAAQPPLSRAHAHTSRGCARQGCGVMRRRAGPASLHPRPTIHGAAPCVWFFLDPRGSGEGRGSNLAPMPTLGPTAASTADADRAALHTDPWKHKRAAPWGCLSVF